VRVIVTASKIWLVSRMEYKQFRVQAFEREPGKWRANVRRGDGKPVKFVAERSSRNLLPSLTPARQVPPSPWLWQ
jgi:hypothetical protein